MRLLLLTILLLSLLAGCTKTEQPLVPIPVTTVDFRNPVVGQQNIYTSYSFRCGEAIPAPVTSLTLTVTAVTDELIELTETSQDSSFAPVILHAHRVPGNLIISAEERANSQLLFFYGSDSIRLDAPPVASLEYRDCVFYHDNQVFTGDYVASVNEFTFGDHILSNLKTVSCVPMILDLDGYLLYNDNNLMASIQAWRDFGSEARQEVYLLQQP